MSVWKGLNNTSKTDLKLLNKNGKKVTDPQNC